MPSYQIVQAALVRKVWVCHGVNEAQRGPILDGMDYWYLLDQLSDSIQE